MQLNGTFRTTAPLRCHPEAGVDGWWVEWFWMSRQMLTVSDDHYQSGLFTSKCYWVHEMSDMTQREVI